MEYVTASMLKNKLINNQYISERNFWAIWERLQKATKQYTKNLPSNTRNKKISNCYIRCRNVDDLIEFVNNHEFVKANKFKSLVFIHKNTIIKALNELKNEQLEKE